MAEAFLCSWWLSGSLRHRGPRLRPHLHGEALFTRCLWEVGSCSPRLPWSTASFSTGLLRPLSASPVSATPGPQPELGEQATHMPPGLAAWSPGQPPASLRVSCYRESHQVFHRLLSPSALAARQVPTPGSTCPAR